MRFPGKRKSKHYFPVEIATKEAFDFEAPLSGRGVYIVGIDQLIVDIEAHVDEEFLDKYGILKGESIVLDEKIVDEIYWGLKDSGKVVGEYAGGAVGNTLHNYSVLTDDRSVALGPICRNITVGDYAFQYICKTHYQVDLSYLRPCDGNMARALCFITPDGERSFAIGQGIMNELTPDYIHESLIQGASSLLISTFLLRDSSWPIFESTLKAIDLANKHDVPVVLALGTSFLVQEKREFLLDLIKNKVSVLAMNEKEAQALVGESDPLLAGEKILDLADLALITVGEKGLYLCGHVDEEFARKTRDQIHSKSIPEYNEYEYSRAMLKADCKRPMKFYTHINPYMGGPLRVKNTNGAGDAALAALLHDMSANRYHQMAIPRSPKHSGRFLTYSSLHQISKYANRVSYEVLSHNSPRLICGLPEKEDSLEGDYWSR